jgi:ABC-2 type transport system permease protein
MKYSLLVALREYSEHIKTKGFWIGILMLPVMLFMSFKVPMLLDEMARPTRLFVVYDPSGKYGSIVDQAIQAEYDKRNGLATLAWAEQKKQNPSIEDFKPPKKRYLRVPIPNGVDTTDAQHVRESLKPYLVGDATIDFEGEQHKLFALVIIPQNENKLRDYTEFWCTNLADEGLKNLVADGFAKELQHRELQEKGLKPKDIERIDKIDVKLAGKDPSKEEGKESVSEAESWRQKAPVAFVYLLFVAIMTVAQMLLSSTIEEKSNRIVEVLLSSVTPWELMLGKLLGVAASGLTMLAAWIVSAVLMFQWFVSSGSSIAAQVFHLIFAPGMLVPFVIYFVLGYLMYASLLLALGSTCNTLKDAQNFMAPIMIVLVLPIMSMFFIVNDPNGVLAKTMSWIPVFTPFVMMNRIAGSPPMSDVIGTSIMLVVTIALVIWLSGRIFRIGILRTGQPPKLLELLRLAKG